jgi:hypothetical protein
MDKDTERGASEEASGVPLTPTEEETSKRPASQPPSDSEEEEEEEQAGEHLGGGRPEDRNPDDFE